jgi:hypothetical protein
LYYYFMLSRKVIIFKDTKEKKEPHKSYE